MVSLETTWICFSCVGCHRVIGSSYNDIDEEPDESNPTMSMTRNRGTWNPLDFEIFRRNSCNSFLPQLILRNSFIPPFSLHLSSCFLPLNILIILILRPCYFYIEPWFSFLFSLLWKNVQLPRNIRAVFSSFLLIRNCGKNINIVPDFFFFLPPFPPFLS